MNGDFLQIFKYSIYMSGVKGNLFTAFYMARVQNIAGFIAIGTASSQAM